MQLAATGFAVALAAAFLGAQEARAQVFVDAPGNIPQGSPFNDSRTEQVDFADIDLDGDWDCGVADGGDIGNDQNRIWINLGGLQGGTIGFFADETATRAPAVLDQSRDLEFVDFDGDGDPDAFSVNTAQTANQGGRWWTNQGGLQAGVPGFFVDDTATRWVGIGGAGSSVHPSLVLAGGGFVTYAQDQDFADVDADGDLDLVAAAVGNAFSGKEPIRIFLNEGLGTFREFNPSGFQLAGPHIVNGNPALWAEGVHQTSTTDVTGAFADIAGQVQELLVGDLDGDLDVDVLTVLRAGTPRLYRNRLSETGTLGFRDFTGITWPQGYGGSPFKYDTELADFDGDDDLDLYGINWAGAFPDATLRGAGDGTFVDPTSVAGTQGDDDGSDVVDYDNDGDLDVYVPAWAGGEKLMGNSSTGHALAFAVVPGAIGPGLPSSTVGANAADVDGDGDGDLMRSNWVENHLLLNTLNVPDTTAPRLVRLEQPVDHASGHATRIRVQLYDNAGADETAWAEQVLHYSVDNGPFVDTPMAFSGGQVFRGELPAAAVGNVRYRVTATDEHGNSGSSKLKSIDTAGGCSGQVATYCVGKLNTDGCVPTIEFEGAPEVNAAAPFTIRGLDVLPGMTGLLFYSKSGPAAVPFAGGTICVGAGLLRTPGQVSSGAGACGGAFVFDFNAWIALGADPALVAGQKVWAQYWYRDVQSFGGSGLTDGVTFTICP